MRGHPRRYFARCQHWYGTSSPPSETGKNEEMKAIVHVWWHQWADKWNRLWDRGQHHERRGRHRNLSLVIHEALLLPNLPHVQACRFPARESHLAVLAQLSSAYQTANTRIWLWYQHQKLLWTLVRGTSTSRGSFGHQWVYVQHI